MRFTIYIPIQGTQKTIPGVASRNEIHFDANPILALTKLDVAPTLVGKILPNPPRYELLFSDSVISPDLHRALSLEEVHTLIRHSQNNPAVTQSLAKAIADTHAVIASMPSSAREELRHVSFEYRDDDKEIEALPKVA